MNKTNKNNTVTNNKFDSTTRVVTLNQNNATKKQGLFSTLIHGNKELKEMRKEWEETIEKISEKNNQIERDLKDLEELCNKFERMLNKDSSKKESNFKSIANGVVKINKHTHDAKVEFKKLEPEISKFDLEKQKAYKNADKDEKVHLKKIYAQILDKTKKIANQYQYNADKKDDADDSVSESIVDSSDDSGNV